MAKSGSGRPASRQLVRGRHAPSFVPGVPGLPVHLTFRLRETRRLLFTGLGLLAAAGVAGALWKVIGWRGAIPVVAAGGLLGLILAMLLARDRCVERGCGAVLPPGTRQCPRCGATIIGALALSGRAAGEED